MRDSSDNGSTGPLRGAKIRVPSKNKNIDIFQHSQTFHLLLMIIAFVRLYCVDKRMLRSDSRRKVFAVFSYIGVKSIPKPQSTTGSTKCCAVPACYVNQRQSRATSLPGLADAEMAVSGLRDRHARGMYKSVPLSCRKNQLIFLYKHIYDCGNGDRRTTGITYVRTTVQQTRPPGCYHVRTYQNVYICAYVRSHHCRNVGSGTFDCFIIFFMNRIWEYECGSTSGRFSIIYKS